MILNPGQIENIIVNNPNAALITRAKDYNKTLRLHLYGEDMESHLTKIDGFEEEAMRNLRVKYARSNKDLFSRLSRPIDKVFTARGGSTYYNLGESGDKQASAMAMDVRSGYTAKKWVESYWKPHYLDDPMGFIFMEIGDGVNYPDGQAYPTYKSVSGVYDYSPKGNRLDWVCWELTAEEKSAHGIDAKEQVYRLVDDAFDYYVKKEQKTVTILQAHTLPNYFGQVPAILNSDIISPKDDQLHLSVFDDCIELAEDFLNKGSIKALHDFFHGFPKYWEYADDCNDCNGSGFQGADKCSSCKGSGKKLMSKPADVKLLRHPETKDTPIVTPEVAGYVEPSEIFYNIATNGLQSLESLMNTTLWGNQPKVQKQGMATDGEGTKTATEVIDDQQPMIDRLTAISETAEKRHKFIIDLMVQVNLDKPAYVQNGGCSVNYGRRYMIESIDQILTRYTSAKTAGLTDETLNDLLIEFIETKYAGDPVGMAITLKLMQVEPFIHYTAGEVEGSAIIPAVDKIAKRFFGEWRKKQANDVLILSMSVEGLTEMLYTYAKDQQAKVQEETKAQQAHEINLKTAKAPNKAA